MLPTNTYLDDPRPDEPGAPVHLENSTDATRGQPLALRAQKRKAELEAALEKLPADQLRASNDIALALSTVDGLLTGELENLSDATASALSRWLENTKHLAETTPSSTPDETTASSTPDETTAAQPS